MNVLNRILGSSRTVFTTQSLMLLNETGNKEKLNNSLNYYAKKNLIKNPKRGIYTKPNYNPKEMACSLIRPLSIELGPMLAEGAAKNLQLKKVDYPIATHKAIRDFLVQQKALNINNLMKEPADFFLQALLITI